jgi:hypothetical protein
MATSRVVGEMIAHRRRSAIKLKRRKRVGPGIDRDPAVPQPITFLPGRKACAHGARLLVRQSYDGIGMGLEVEPPRGTTLVLAVHRERDEVGAVFGRLGEECPPLRPVSPALREDAA